MTNPSEPVALFLSGKGTTCEWRFDTGVGRGRILNVGDGMYLEERFASPAQARRFCERRVQENPALVFYIMIEGEIVDSVLDSRHHESKARRRGLVYSIVSTLAIAAAALAVSLFAVRLETVEGHAIFVAAMVSLYLLLLFTGGNRNVDGAIAMFFVLLLAAAVGSPIKKHFEEKKSSWPTEGVLRGGARACGDFRVPALDVVGALVGYGHLRAFRELDGDEGGDVGDGEGVTRDERIVGELSIEKSEKPPEALLAAIDQRRDLGHAALDAGESTVLEQGQRVSNRLGRRHVALKLDPPVPHLDDCLVLGVPSHERRLGVQLLDVAADRNGLGDVRAVV